jgi:hypothetical protein
MKKAADDKIKGMVANEEMQGILDKFLSPTGNTPFMFALPKSGEELKYQLEPPTQDAVKKKVILCVRTTIPSKGEERHIDETNVMKEVIFMEINR